MQERLVRAKEQVSLDRRERLGGLERTDENVDNTERDRESIWNLKKNKRKERERKRLCYFLLLFTVCVPRLRASGPF